MVEFSTVTSYDSVNNTITVNTTTYTYANETKTGSTTQQLYPSNNIVGEPLKLPYASLTDLNNKVNKSGDTMTGGLTVEDNIYIKYSTGKYFLIKNTGQNYTNTTAPSSTVGLGGFVVQDTNDKNFGGMSLAHDNYNNIVNTLYARRSINGTEKSAYIQVYVDSSGNGHCNLPQSSNIDGQWVDSNQTFFTTSPSLNASTNLEYRIDLPNDGKTYEVLIRGRIQTGSTSGNYCYLMGRGNQDSYTRNACGARTRSSSSVLAIGTLIVTASYVASGSKNLYITRSTNFTGGTLEALETVAYRRIGTNS